MKLLTAFATVALVLTAGSSQAGDQIRTHRVKFEPGKHEAIITDKVKGEELVVFKINARDGQFLKVSLHPDSKSADYNIYIPGRGPGDEALYNSELGGTYVYTGQLYKTGDHSISVFLNRAAARRGESTKFKIAITITDKPPGEKAKPAADPKFDAAIKASLDAVRKQVGHNGVSLLRVEETETAILVYIKVQGGENPWRCSYNGTKVTEVMYMGEG